MSKEVNSLSDSARKQYLKVIDKTLLKSYFELLLNEAQKEVDRQIGGENWDLHTLEKINRRALQNNLSQVFGFSDCPIHGDTGYLARLDKVDKIDKQVKNKGFVDLLVMQAVLVLSSIMVTTGLLVASVDKQGDREREAFCERVTTRDDFEAVTFVEACDPIDFEAVDQEIPIVYRDRVELEVFE